jgi:hypothetical protein
MIESVRIGGGVNAGIANGEVCFGDYEGRVGIAERPDEEEVCGYHHQHDGDLEAEEETHALSG